MRFLRLAVIAAVALAAGAAPAHATDYCVSPASSCTPGNTFTAIQPALTAAQAPGSDRVLIGSAQFDLPAGSLSYSGDAVEILGVGAVPPVLRQPTTSSSDAALTFNHGGAGRSTIRGLDFVVAQNTTGAAGPNAAVFASGAVDIIGIGARAAPDATRALGVALSGSATLRQSDILFGYLADVSMGVLDVSDSSDATSVSDSAINADDGVFVSSGATLTVNRSQFTVSRTGLSAFDATINANNPVVRLEPQAVVTNSAFVATASSRNTSIDIRYATVTGGDGNSVGMFVQSSATNTASGSLLDSIVRNLGTTLYRAGPPGTPGASLAANYNAFHPSAIEGNNATTPGTYINLNARTEDPHFLGGGDPDGLRLRHNSPFIDGGHPAPLALPTDDFGGDGRVVDGNGDGTARGDLGAYEYQRVAPTVAAAAAPAAALPGEPITWSASGSDEDGDPLTYTWSFDDGQSASGASVTHAFTPIGAHGGTVTATDATGLTATASAGATVNPAPVTPGGGGGGGGAPAPDLLAPRFSIAGRSLTLSRKNVIAVRLTCDAAETEPCAGTLTLASARRVGKGRRKSVLQLGRVPFSVTPGRTSTLKVKVSKRKAAQARALRRFQVKATAVAGDRAGNRATKSSTVALAAPNVRKRR
jgi:hypothetical protein